MKYDGIIFDLDGTLWDSTRTVADSWNASMKSLGEECCFTAEDIAGIMGCTDKQIEKKLFDAYGERAHGLCKVCMSEEPPYVAVYGGRIYEGTEAMLEALSAQKPLFIVSNCQSGYVEAFLSYSGYGRYFRDYEYQGRQGLSKAENIGLIMRRHRLENCVYVGDTAHDAHSAHSAGCDFVYAAYGFGSCDEYEAVIESPAQLYSTLAEM